VVLLAIHFHNEVVKPTIVFLLLTGAVALYAKDKHPKKQDDSSQDQITVAAHIPSTGGPVTRFIATQHYGRSYVYAEHESGKTLTLIDVTNPGQPRVLADVAYPDNPASSSLLTATGTAALVTDTPVVEAKPAQAQIIRIMNLADPLHPTVAQEFKGVTATSRDVQPGLILLANADGIWVLQQHFALDPAVEKSYAYKVIYGESMYH
jgi:hypothetical protein